MKVLLLTLALVAGSLAAVVLDQKTLGSGPACPLDDPLFIEPGDINVTVLPIFELDVGSTQGGGVAIGLTTVFYEYTINYLTLTVSFSAGVSASIDLDAYDVSGIIDATPFSEKIAPSGPYTGSGTLKGSIGGGFIAGSVTIFVNIFSNKISISKLVIDEFKFDSLTLDLENFKSNDVPYDWAEWNANINENFATEYPEHGAEFFEIVRVDALNPLLAEFTLQDLWDIIGEGSTPAPCDATPATI